MPDSFASMVETRGPVALPAFSGVRVMMLPFRLEAIADTLPQLPTWWSTVESLRAAGGVDSGTAYLTIDEADVPTGETHRRPGLHVDGVGGGWGGGGGGWGKNGMVIAASHFGSRAWRQDFVGAPGREGDCEHLRAQTRAVDEVPLVGGHVFWLDPLCVHEAVPMQEAARRQFVRLSLPNDAPWFEGYTESAVGVRPTGDILPARVAFMRYRGG